MGSATIKGVLDLLRGEKVKDRQEGFVALQTFFADDSAVDNVDTSGKGDAWLVIFSAVFSAVEKEKQAYAKKGDASSATVKRRLADAASAVRSLVERSVLRMNGKVVKAVLSQLSKHVIDGNELLAPVALQYAKAIRSVLSYTPHLERLGEKMWTSLLQLSLNVVLGDRVKRSLEETDMFIQENEDAQAGSSGEDAGDDDMSTPGPSSSRKRKVSAIQQHARRTPFSASPAPSTHPVTQEQVEFMSLVVLLLRSPSAPLLSPPLEYSHVPTALFNRLVRILQTYPGDSSIHHDYLLALSAALSHVALNDCVIVTMYAREAWDGLLNMWGTKNQRMKQDLVIVLQTLFPYYTAEPLDPTAVPEMDCAKGVSRLWHLLSREADSRWGVDGLNLDRLRLEVREIRADATPPQPFVGSTYRFGWQFDSGHALAWMILELQSSCTAKVARPYSRVNRVLMLCRSFTSSRILFTRWSLPIELPANVSSWRVLSRPCLIVSVTPPPPQHDRTICKVYFSSSTNIGLSFMRSCSNKSFHYSCSLSRSKTHPSNLGHSSAWPQ